MKRLLSIGVLTSFGLVALLASGLDRDASAWPHRVLITNDDGIDTPGIRALAEALARDAVVYVVAPAGNRSGAGGYVGSLSQPMTVTELDWGDRFGGVYAVSGYPADGIVWGLESLLADESPDLVISGINDGANAGGAWLVSGTIGAARTAAFLGVPALAVSGYDSTDPEAVRQVADWLGRFVEGEMVRGLQPGEYLLVNMPRSRMDEVADIVVAPLDLAFVSFGMNHEAESDTWRGTFGVRGQVDPDGDWAALRRGEIVITPMRIGEMGPLERYRRMLGAVPRPIGDAR